MPSDFSLKNGCLEKSCWVIGYQKNRFLVLFFPPLLGGMVEKSPPQQADFFGGLTSLLMGWDQSSVDGNGMGWKLLCVVTGWDDGI